MSTYRSRAYGADEIRAFLHAVDRHLTLRVRVEIIGGGAAALAHGASSTTTDLNTLNAVNNELLEAVARASEETGFQIPVFRQRSPMFRTTTRIVSSASFQA